MMTLKGQDIPTDGHGVIIFDDIGGYRGSGDGLQCVYNRYADNRYWSYTNGTKVTASGFPQANAFGADSSTCHFPNGVSLYYAGRPLERGRFQCTFNQPKLSVSVYIVDMTISRGPTGPSLVVAGDETQLSISVNITPNDVPVPYQWQLNGINIADGDKYRGTQTDTLTILNAQLGDQGMYRCSVARSASGYSDSVQLTVGELNIPKQFCLILTMQS